MERYLNAKEIIEALNISRTTAYALMKRADFPSTRIGRKIVVSEIALREWLERGGTAQEA